MRERYDLSNGDGSKTLCLQVKDSLDNISGTTTHSIILDATAPSSTVSTTGTYGPVTTGGPQTAFMGSATDTGGSAVASVVVSIEDIGSGLYLNSDKSGFDATSPEWHQALGTTSWTLWLDDSLFANGLTYNISSKAQDGAANVQTGTGTNSIFWDTAAPSAQFVINSIAATYANTTTVNLVLDDPSGVAQYRKANSANCSGAAWIGYTTNPIAHTLTASQGAQTVCLEVKDAVGNVSATSTDSIIYESILPVSSVDALGTIGPESQTGATTTLSGTASDDTSGVSSVSISVQAGTGKYLNAGKAAYDATSPVWHVVTGTTTWSFVLDDSLLVDGTYNISSRATDIAGNIQTSFGTNSFIWDKTIDFFLIGQRNYKEAYLDGILPQQNTLNSPMQVVENNGKFFVNDASNNRILIFENGLDNPPDVVIGQASFTDGMLNAGGAVTAKSLYAVIQFEVSGSKLIVGDRANNRVLIWNTIPTANYTPADVVLGQPDFTSNLINRDGTTVTKANGLNKAFGVTVVGSKLLVADKQNNRVLIWNTIPTVSDTSPDLVIGQGDFISGAANRGGTRSANSLYVPSKIQTDGTAIAVADTGNNRVLIWNSVPTNWDANADVVVCQSDFASSGSTATQSGCKPMDALFYGGSFYIVDYSQSRILYYATIPVSGSMGPATGVFGQNDFTSVAVNRGNSAPSNNSVYSPYGININNGNFYISETGNNRILKLNTPPTAVGTEVADAVYGQPDFTSNFSNQATVNKDGFNAIGCMDANPTHLIIGDRYNGRVLVYEKATIENGPIVVIGKDDFTSGCSSSSSPACPAVAANNLSNIEGCAISDDGKIYISDRYRHRVLVYNSIPSVNGQDADYVLGQDNFTTGTANTGTNGYGKLSNPMGIETTATQLFVADHGNYRVLIYDLPIVSNRQLATVVVGQPNETTLTSGLAANKFSGVMGVTVSEIEGQKRLITVEYTNNRVMVFNNIPASNGVSGDFVLGQPDFTTANGANTTQNSFGGTNQTTRVMVVDGILFVPDRSNKRILNFDFPVLSNNANAISVIGQDDYTSSGSVYSNEDGTRFDNLYAPTAIIYDPDGDFVWVAEMSGNSVSRIKKSLFLLMQNSP